jgi:DNA-binding transcriptional regulator YbjK
MPRAADPDLEGRILDAAQKLWVDGGAKALTMRAVARAFPEPAGHTAGPTAAHPG